MSCAEGSGDDAGGSVLFSAVILVPINLDFVILGSFNFVVRSLSKSCLASW